MAVEFEKQGDQVQITLTIPAAEADAIGMELSTLVDRMDTALWALAMLRTGRNDRAEESRPVTTDDLYWVINDLEHRLTPRLKGIRDAAIRRHADLGGTYGQLATAMDVGRSTAQRRRDGVTRQAPTGWERWATED